jgi:TATA-binding protein-associated factor Taf7
VLFKATEQNKMKPWAAKQAAQLKEEGQARLLVQLEKNGRVTTDDVIEARRFRVIQAADSVLPREMFDAEADIPYDDEGDELEVAGAVANRTQNVVATPERVGKRLSEADHKFNAIRGATVAKVSLGKIKKLTENERQALDAIEEALHFLEDEDENVLAIAAVDTALEDGDEEDEEDTDDEESDDDEELDDEETDEEEEADDEDEEEEEFDDEEEEEDQPF